MRMTAYHARLNTTKRVVAAARSAGIVAGAVATNLSTTAAATLTLETGLALSDMALTAPSSWANFELPVTLSTANFIDSAASPDGVFLVMTADNRLLRSENCLAWTETAIGRGNWHSVCWGNNEFLAVSWDGWAARSPDGRKWTLSPMPARHWRAVTYGGGKYVAVGDGSYAAVSVDGVNWSQTQFDTANIQPTAMMWSNVAGKYVMFGQSLNDLAFYSYHSADGAAWTQNGATTAPVDYIAESGVSIVAVGNNGTMYATSTDGIGWIERSISPGFDGYLMPVRNNLWAYVYGGKVYLSSDTVPTQNTFAQIATITYPNAFKRAVSNGDIGLWLPATPGGLGLAMAAVIETVVASKSAIGVDSTAYPLQQRLMISGGDAPRAVPVILASATQTTHLNISMMDSV